MNYYGYFNGKLQLGNEVIIKYGSCDNQGERSPDPFSFKTAVVCNSRMRGKIVRVDA